MRRIVHGTRLAELALTQGQGTALAKAATVFYDDRRSPTTSLKSQVYPTITPGKTCHAVTDSAKIASGGHETCLPSRTTQEYMKPLADVLRYS